MKTFFKNIYSKIVKVTESSIYNNKVLLFLSIFIGVIVWAYITQTVAPDSTITIKDIPVNLEASIAGTAAEKDGYKIYESDITHVDIEVEARRTKLTLLNKNSFIATLSVDKYADEQPVSSVIQVAKAEGNNIDCTYRIVSKSKATVSFYKELTKKLEIFSVNAPNITAAPGYTRSNITCDSILLTGPEPLLNEIDSCVLNMTQKVAYHESTTIPIEPSLDNLTFYDVDNNVINSKLKSYFDEGIIIFSKNISVTINILATVENVAINYELYDVPLYFNEDFIRKRLILSPSEITVSSNSTDASLSEMTTLDVLSDENISLKDIGLNFSTEFHLNEALESRSSKLINNSQSICKVTFDSSGLSSKKIPTVQSSAIKIKNPYPNKFTASILTECINDITLIGPAEDIEKIKSDDLTFEIDISKSTTSDMSVPATGNITYTVTILPSSEYKNVWIYGNYSVVAEISEISGSTTQANINQ